MRRLARTKTHSPQSPPKTEIPKPKPNPEPKPIRPVPVSSPARSTTAAKSPSPEPRIPAAETTIPVKISRPVSKSPLTAVTPVEPVTVKNPWQSQIVVEGGVAKFRISRNPGYDEILKNYNFSLNFWYLKKTCVSFQNVEISKMRFTFSKKNEIFKI